MDDQIFNKFKSLVQDMRQKFTSVRDMLNTDVQYKILFQKQKLNSIFEEMQRVYGEKSYLLSWQEYNVRKNFVRVRDAMEERTLFAVGHAYQELSFQIEDRIAQLSATDASGDMAYSQDVRTAVYLGLKTLIGGRIDLAERALQNYTQLYTAYEEGTPIFRYSYENETQENNDVMTPKPLLKHSLGHNAITRKMCTRVADDLNGFKEALWKYSQIADRAYKNITLDPHEIHSVNVIFLAAGRHFHHSKSVFYSDCIEYPLHVLQNEIEELHRRWRDFKEIFSSLYNNADNLAGELLAIKSSALREFERSADLACKFTQNIDKNMTKLRIANEFTSDQNLENISDLKNCMSNIRTRGQSIYDDWFSLTAASQHIWELILEDENMVEFYTHRNMTGYLKPFVQVSNQLAANYTQIRDDSDFRHLIGNQDSLFLSSLEKMVEHLKNYHETSRLDSKFIRNNFLQLNVFFREKSYEEITQQPGYEMFALLCDIGGSMGLFVGASFLTLYEILDFGLRHCLLRIFQRRMS